LTDTVANSTTATQRQFTVTLDDLGTVRIVNDTTKHTLAALTRREAKRLSRELRAVLKKKNGVEVVDAEREGLCRNPTHLRYSLTGEASSTVSNPMYGECPSGTDTTPTTSSLRPSLQIVSPGSIGTA
jgi:hypothetical protein